MLVTQKMGVRGSRTQNIINVPLPSHKAAKILKDLQTSCNSPNKATQVEALKCWGVWIQSRGSEEWEDDSVCLFAVKPLSTKKLQALHKDSDICKLKLSLLWKMLSKVQGKMELEGPQHILKIFFQTCFAWLSSIDTFDSKIIVLIIKLLLSLFQKFESPIMCDTYTFSPIQIDSSILRKLLFIFNDNILDVFDCWKKVHNNDLIMKLWTCFLENCECGHENITTSVWHRIFKVNQTFCLDHSESVKDRLMFLHACATNVKTVLLSSKYIGGESCFTTPCEALMKKLVEVCSTEVEVAVPESNMFSMCKDVSEVLGNESIVISDYDICIYLLDSLEDFVYKSFLWGAWCGLVECFKKNLLNVELQMFTRKQFKFYRKLRGVSVNFELDKEHLTIDSVAKVESSIEILKVGCFCGPKTPKFSNTSSPQKDENVFPFESMEVDEENFPKESSPPLNFQIVKKASPLAPGGQFGIFPVRTAINKPPVFRFNFEFVKKFYELLKPFHIPFPLLNNIKAEFTLVQNQSCLNESRINIKTCIYNECELPRLLYSESHKDSEESETKDKKEICIAKTRGRKRKEEKQAAETVQIRKKRRKSFEILVQEIVTKNKLRKSEKNTKSKKPNVSEKKELRSRKQLRNLKEEVVPIKQLRERKRVKEKAPKKTNGKLDNFFKVIDPKPNPNKTKKAKKIKGKKEKTEINWKQPSLSGMISSKTLEKEKSNAKTQTKVANKKLKSTPEKKIVQPNSVNATSPFREALQDHEYAKFMESSVSSTSEKQSKKPVRGNKLRRKGNVTNPEISEVDSSILEKVEEQKEVMEMPNLEKLKMEIDDVNLVKLNVENVEINETKKLECDDFLRIHHEKENNDQIKSDCNIKTIEKENLLQIKSPEKSVTNVVCDNQPAENISSDIEQKETEDEHLHENLEKIELVLKNVKKRMPLIYSPRPRKRVKLNEDSLEGGGDSVEDAAEKENLESLQLDKSREILSPIKESLAEISASKDEISPNKKSPSLNRTTSSRALRMMALIPEPTSPLGNQTSYEASSKTGSKHHFKKYIGVDKSSRVSKMLARLSESMKKVEEDLPNRKLGREEDSPPQVSTPKSHKLTAKNISPKPIKKKKFIGFDDSKNETIIFETDTPPSRILEQRILLRDG